MKRGWICVIFLLGISTISAQISGSSYDQIPQIDLPILENEVLLKEELSKREIGRPPSFAQPCDLDADCHQEGEWFEELGKSIWRLIIHSKGAQSLNFGFSNFYLPSSASFYLIGLNSGIRRGPFTVADNESHDQFWSPIIQDDRVMLELSVDHDQKELVRLELMKVNHAFVKFGSNFLSGSCNLDIICGAGDSWGRNDNYRDIIRSVVIYSINGSTACTGALINNAREDGTPYLLTANHCDVSVANASSVVVYYNYENSVCRQPNSPQSGNIGDGVFSVFNSGADWISASDQFIGSDFNLLRLDDPINPNANAYLAGWSRMNLAPDSAIAIHHPNLNEKRISYEDDPLTITDREQSIVNPAGSFLRVLDWDIGTTEPGSSGSPLFDTQNRIIGQLYGGFASCANNASDWYGRISESWNGLGSTSTRLRDYLDPDNIEMDCIDGKETNECLFYSSPDQYVTISCKPNDVLIKVKTSSAFTGEVSYSVIENNTGGTIGFSPAILNPGDSATITISNTAIIASGTHGIRIGITDDINSTELPLWITVGEGTPAQIIPSFPLDDMQFVVPSTNLQWQEANTGTYDLQLSLDAIFSNLIIDQTNINFESVETNTALTENTQYFWRVRNVSLCNVGPWSETRRFTTGSISCETVISADSFAISEMGANTVFSTINIFGAGQVASVVVDNIFGTHTWIEDLSFSLISPSGQEVILLAQQCGNEDNFDIGFDDSAASSNVACPYIGGLKYTPAMPLNSFSGLDLAGEWRLKVIDNADGDGGVVMGWTITICKTENPEASLVPDIMDVDLCGTVNLTVPITIGTGFMGDVDLSIENTVTGLSASLSSNVVQPGESTILQINGSITQDSVLIIRANDGIISSRVPIALNLSSVPQAFSLDTPSNLESAATLSSTFKWNSSLNANEYRYEIAEDVGFSNMAFSNTINDTSTTIQLNQLTTYYWRVVAINDCDDITSETRSFTTEQKFNFDLLADTIYTCSSDVTYKVVLNGGFTGDINSQILDPPTGASISFENNPGQILDTIRIQFSNLDMMASAYNMTLRLFDDQDTLGIPIFLEVQESPLAPVLTNPMNNEGNIDTIPTFEFMGAANATSYKFELSTDLAFTNIIYQINGLATSDPIQSGIDLDNNTIYYWRIASQNECGLSFSPIFTFMTEPNVAVDNVFKAESISIVPNPANKVFNIEIKSNAIIDGNYFLYNINGQLIQRGNVSSYSNTIDAGSLSSGIYMIRIQDDLAFVVKKLIIF